MGEHNLTKIDLLKFEARRQGWKKLKNGLYHCPIHKTTFDYDEIEFVPCWYCWEECQTEK